MNKTYSNSAQVPQEEVKAQHNQMQKMYAPLSICGLFFSYECKTPPSLVQLPFAYPLWQSK